jgi:hypothetical protein
MRRVLAAVTVLGLPLLATGPAWGQAGGACYRGRPQPACRSFWLTEAEVGIALTQRTRLTGEDMRLGIELGWMHAIGERSAVGGGVAIGHDQSEYLSLRPRYRRWLPPIWALDLSPGVRWTPGRIEVVEARAALHWRDLGGVWTEVDFDLAGLDRTRWLAGVKTGAQAGLASYAIGAVTFLIYLVAFPRD